MTCRFAVMLVFPGPPQVRAVEAGDDDAIGADDSSVEVQTYQPGRQNGPPLVGVTVGSGSRQIVVADELGKTGVLPGALSLPGLGDTADRAMHLALTDSG